MSNCGEQAVVDHLARAAAALFGRLEDQVDRAVEIALLGKVLGGCEQHGGMAVVAAGVHLAGVLAFVFERVVLLHGQGVHVGAQANGAAAGAAVAPVHDADHAGGAHPTVDGDAPFRELAGHQIGGAHFFKAQFGVGVDVTAQAGNGCGLGNEGVDDLHGAFPSECTV
jgi:hypothetical protein